jgi:SynChlorMet cassette radical SAM/SPASM protein ScmE
VHDALRGKGAFVKAVEGLCNLKKNKVNVTVRVTVNKYNTGDLGNIAKFLLGELGLASFSTNSASYMGLCRQFSEEIQLTVDEHSKAMAELVRLDQTYNGRISAMAGPLANAWTWLQMDMARKKGLKDVPGCGYLTSCGGILNKLAVRSDGAILPCLLMPHIELGWINTDNLLKIWEGHPELKRLRQRVSVPLSNFDFCNGCEYVNYCRGNCPALAHTILGNDFHPSPDSCLRLFLKQGGKLPEEVLRSTDRMQ